jgi:hypothetical protein
MHPSTNPKRQKITPSTSFTGAPPTPQSVDDKRFPEASRIIQLFKDIQAGQYAQQLPWTHYKLVPGEYEEIERRIKCDETLWGYVNDKLRYV